jgi:two-component system, cell cycle sensor histidine kinase and response regulator CckA
MSGPDDGVARQSRDIDLRLRLVVDNVDIILWSVDAQGVLTMSEGRGLAKVGILPGQSVGKSMFELYPDVPAVAESVRGSLAGEERSYQTTLRGRVFESRCSPLRLTPDGPVTGVIGFSIDVTERERAETERASLQAQLLQAQKMESLGLLAGGIAHDFNNILTAILGGATAAQLTLPPESAARADLEIVIKAAGRAADLTHQMLAYSGKGHFEIRPIDVSRTVADISSLLETTISKKVQLTLSLPTGLPTIEADAAQVQQVLMNLVINGAEAIGDQRGTVVVTTGVQHVGEADAQQLFAAQLPSGPYVFIQVQDSGIGMDAVTQSKIFDPFFTTKFTGRGLGLAAVLGIVRRHRGAIKLDSTPGRGSTFKVLFPASQQPPVQAPKADPVYRGQGLALIIDDDAGVRAAARRLFEAFGFKTVEAENGRLGAELFSRRAAEITVVLLDMTMPDMTGEETFDELRRVGTDVPVILTSGYSEVEATSRFTAKGLAGFLQKPFGPADLAATLRAALGRKR